MLTTNPRKLEREYLNTCKRKGTPFIRDEYGNPQVNPAWYPAELDIAIRHFYERGLYHCPHCRADLALLERIVEDDTDRVLAKFEGRC